MTTRSRPQQRDDYRLRDLVQTHQGLENGRLVPLPPQTLKRLEAITEGLRARSGVSVEPMQLAALLLEKTTEQFSEEEVQDVAEHRREHVEALRKTGAVAWSGQRLRPAKPVGRVRGSKTAPDLAVDNRE